MASVFYQYATAPGPLQVMFCELYTVVSSLKYLVWCQVLFKLNKQEHLNWANMYQHHINQPIKRLMTDKQYHIYSKKSVWQSLQMIYFLSSCFKLFTSHKDKY